MAQKMFTMDQLDHQLVQALLLDGRIPFARFAHLFGVSEQTVARRFRRLRAAGVVRVLGMVDPTPLGESSWVVRIQSRPDAAVALGDALARRPDVGWVTLTSGGSEIICVARSRTSRQRDELLLQRLPKTAEVTGFSAHALLHRFDTPVDSLIGSGELTAEQVKSILGQSIGGGVTSATARTTDPDGDDRPELRQLSAPDEAMLAELALDGRTPVVRLSAVTGWTAARVARRIEELVEIGLLYFDADLALDVLGYRSQAFLWMTVDAAQLRATGEKLAQHDVVQFVAATTGPSNLIAAVACRDNAGLYRFVTDGLGSIGALRQLEVSPTLRRVKQGGSMMDGERLA